MDEQELLDALLDGTAEALDIPSELRIVAVEEYGRIAIWLAKRCNAPGEIRIYPQGSFRLGTVVLPTAFGDQYDIDLVFLRWIGKESTTQSELKAIVGELLASYVESRRHDPNCPKLVERGRCWTLEYSGLRFHLDILPTIPDDEALPNGVLLTDRDLFRWQHSNPIGYADWFRQRETETEIKKAAAIVASARGYNIADVPEHLIRTPLQRLVQIMKRHRDLHFADDLDNRPPSILLTTLVAHAYRGEDSLIAALTAVLSRMDSVIENRNGVWWVENPAHAGENFADKWNTAPERRTAFLDWVRSLAEAMIDLRTKRGLDTVAASLGSIFGESQVKVAVTKMGDRTRRAAPPVL